MHSQIYRFSRALCCGFFVFSLACLPRISAQGLPPGVPGGPGLPGAAAGPVEVPAAEDVLEGGMAIPNASIIQVVLPLYQELTGRQVILDTNIADNNVRIVMLGPVDREEAIEFIEDTLMLNGYVFVPTNRENTFKLINAGGGQNPRGQGIPVFTDGRDLPESDALVAYIMTLQYINPEEAVRIFPQIVQMNSYGSIVAVPNASAVIITENVPLIRQLIALRERVDVSAAQTRTKFFDLERADAERVADFLREFLEIEDFQGARVVREGIGGASAPPAPPQNVGGDAAAAAAAAAGGAGTGAVVGSAPSIRIMADPRTNRIVAQAREIDLLFIEQLVEELDKESEARTFRRFSLQFITASEFITLAEQALSRDLGETATSAGDARTRQTGRQATTQAQEFGARMGGEQVGGFGVGRSGGSTRTGGSFGLSTPDAPPVAEAVTVGKAFLVADNERNTLLVTGPPESTRLVAQLVEELDQRPRQVILSTVIGQLALGNDLKLGVDAVRTLEEMSSHPPFSGAGSFLSSGRDGFFDLDDLLDVGGFPATPGLSLYGRLRDDLSFYVNMLEETNRFKVLSRPSIKTANNRRAIIQSGQRIAVPTNTITGGGTAAGSVTSNIEYRDVVLKLEVVPLINSEREVTLTISQLNDNVIGSQVVAGNTVPIIGTQELLTTVTASNGQTVLLGGLITERDERTVSGMPVLVHIPVLKHLVSTTSTTKKRDELLVFIQPKIVDTEEDLIRANLEELERAQLTPDALEFAVPWYDRRMDEPQVETEPRGTRTGSRF